MTDEPKPQEPITAAPISRNWVQLGIVSVAAVAFAAGFRATLAANWPGVSPLAKVAAYFAVQISIGATLLSPRSPLLTAAKKDSDLWWDAVILLFNLTFLSGIDLVGHIYHIRTNGWGALLFWVGLALPATLLAATRLPPLVWCVALMAASVYSLEDASTHGAILLAMPSAVALGLLAIGLADQTLAWLPGPSRRAFLEFSLAVLAVLTVVTAVVMAEAATTAPAWGLGVLAAGTVALLAVRQLQPSRLRRSAAATLICLVVLLALPSLYHSDHELGRRIVGCCLFFLCWTLAGATAVAANQRSLFNLAALVVAGRLLGIYFEIFGSLWRTGVGLMTIGAAVAAGAYCWYRWGATAFDRLSGRAE